MSTTLLTTKTASVLMPRGLPTGAAPRFTASTDDPDAERDRVFQEGLSHRDPLVVLFAHESRKLPMGMVTAVHRFPHRTEMEFRWFENDPEVARVRNIFEQGGLAASIGFQVEDAVPNAHGGFDIRKARVVEVSLVPVAANEHARALAKSLATRRDDEPVLILRDDDDADARLTVDPAEVRRTVEPVLRQQVADAVRRHVASSGLLGLAEPPVLRFEDDDGTTRTVDADTLRAALDEVFQPVVTREVRTALNKITGRVD